LRKIRKILSKGTDSDKEKQKLVSGLIDYGMIVFENFDAENTEDNIQVVGFFIMPKYTINLESYIIKEDRI
jgi:hypothetical protein